MKIVNCKLKILNGFTLIEIMLVIAIVIILVAGSIAGMTASRDRRNVKTTADRLKYFLEEARAKAVTPDDTSFGVVKIMIKVFPESYAANPNQIRAYTETASNVETEIAKFEAPKGITVSVPQSPTDGNMSTNGGYYFGFDAMTEIGQLTNRAPTAGSNDPVYIEVSDSSDKYDLIINNSGLITVEKQ